MGFVNYKTNLTLAQNQPSRTVSSTSLKSSLSDVDVALSFKTCHDSLDTMLANASLTFKKAPEGEVIASKSSLCYL